MQNVNDFDAQIKELEKEIAERKTAICPDKHHLARLLHPHRTVEDRLEDLHVQQTGCGLRLLMAEGDKNLHQGRSPVETDVLTADILCKKVREVKDATGLTELEAKLDDLKLRAEDPSLCLKQLEGDFVTLDKLCEQTPALREALEVIDRRKRALMDETTYQTLIGARDAQSRATRTVADRAKAAVTVLEQAANAQSGRPVDELLHDIDMLSAVVRVNQMAAEGTPPAVTARTLGKCSLRQQRIYKLASTTSAV
ncbi:hypothetical protein AAT19DRAFT_13334 [Rhodotorula toruloides]|uniref:Uncharacterized protein n=1 Tax=Rhodotorula toruloides TaxID=5286 RepID=A0A2T0AE89_RHOTO|nr:hypothetical protein AAT19DRAFT_13334 [Rhodotorula toruloides]